MKLYMSTALVLCSLSAVLVTAQTKQPATGDDAVVRADRTLVAAFEKGDGVDRLRAFGARGEFVDELGRRLLVRQRDVHAPQPPREQAQGLAPKTVRRDVEQPVHQILRSRFGEHAVNERGPAVSDRVARDPVLIRCIWYCA